MCRAPLRREVFDRAPQRLHLAAHGPQQAREHNRDQRQPLTAVELQEEPSAA